MRMCIRHAHRPRQPEKRFACARFRSRQVVDTKAGSSRRRNQQRDTKPQMHSTDEALGDLPPPSAVLGVNTHSRSMIAPPSEMVRQNQ